jgi:hypothetical protein
VLDVATRDEAMAILDADPATRAGMRGKLIVERRNTAILGGVVAD